MANVTAREVETLDYSLNGLSFAQTATPDADSDLDYSLNGLPFIGATNPQDQLFIVF